MLRLPDGAWERMVNLYRAGQSPVVVAREAQVAYNTARRAWEKGWPEHGLAPIKELLAAERLAAEAQMEAEAQAASTVAGAKRIGETHGALDRKAEEAGVSADNTPEDAKEAARENPEAVADLHKLFTQARAYGIRTRISELKAALALINIAGLNSNIVAGMHQRIMDMMASVNRSIDELCQVDATDFKELNQRLNVIERYLRLCHLVSVTNQNSVQAAHLVMGEPTTIQGIINKDADAEEDNTDAEPDTAEMRRQGEAMLRAVEYLERNKAAIDAKAEEVDTPPDKE